MARWTREARRSGMVIGGVVEHDHRAHAASAVTAEQMQEGFERLGIKDGAEHGDQLAGMEIDRTEQGQRFARRRMEDDGVLCFGWNPHPAARAVLLEMAFVQAPEIQVVIVQHPAEFFYMRPATVGLLGR